MELLKYFRTSLLQVISLLCVLGFLLGVLNLYFSDKTNYCDMTYMYEYPQFVRIHFNNTSHYPAYGLYAYSEGRLTEKARKVRFDGIPVLFLPGNAGSHMQARSLASVALRKALSAGYDFHFDYFTISYNEELTGLYGGTLEKQTEFAAKCINKILDLYTPNKYTKHVPKHVIVIGHSMGGVIASRLLTYHKTINSTKIVITLAAPLKAPVILFDSYQDTFYRHMESGWIQNLDYMKNFKEEKMLISFGNGPRDVLVPSSLTSYNHSFISVLTTTVPGAWVSPDHVCVVWCKQLVMSINKYLFSLVDPRNYQIEENMQIVKDKAKRFYVTNRTMTLNPLDPLQNSTMVADAFWYEDNRRIYQVYRPGIEKMTYLMIRLVAFPQNRFVAVEAVNVDDQEWVFGCNAKHTYNVHRYCKHATSLSKLSRWTAVANKTLGKRKLATIHLHNLKTQHPEWTHVIVKVSPTRKPVTLNVDINDFASRQVEVNLPSRFLSFGAQRIIIQKTEQDSLYYELILKDFSTLPEAYLLYVEPIGSCPIYHVSAEVHVPWAENQGNYHYFTHLKRSPMKLRLFTTKPSEWSSQTDQTEHVKITLLLDPKCSFTVSISSSWYHILGQLVRNYTPLLIPFVVGIVLMTASCSISSLWKSGSCMSFHSALNCERIRPYYVIWLGRVLYFGVSFVSFFSEYSSSHNTELEWVLKSSVVFLAYMVAMGLLNIGMTGVMCAMAFSSQIDRLIFRIFWGSGTTLGERLAYAVRKVPILLSAVMVAAVPVSCGAAALAIGAAFYAYLISKMFQDYFEDLFYKISAKIASKICLIIRKPKRNPRGEEIKWRNLKELEKEGCQPSQKKAYSRQARDEDLSNINFHVMMFSLWIIATLLNLPTLLAWARNFKYETKLPQDPSFEAGILLSACSGFIWQEDGAQKFLKNYVNLSIFIYVVGVIVIVVGPFSLVVANYAVTTVFCAITLHQLLDKPDTTITHMKTEDCDKIDDERVNIRGRNSAPNWNYLSQMISGAKKYFENIINRNNKPSDADDANEKNTSAEEIKENKANENREGKNNNEQDARKNVGSKDRDERSKRDRSTEDRSNNEERKRENCEGNGINDAGLGDGASASNNGSSDSCDIQKSNNEERKRENCEGNGINDAGLGDGASASNNGSSDSCDIQKSNNEERKRENCEGNGINDAGLGDGASASNNGSSDSCDVCDESRIYKVFETLREKLSFNE